MKYLKIQNKGELDIRLISLMGGTTKKDKPELIGSFGSGMKYVLAYLLRNNLDFKVFIGEGQVDISTKSEQIRDTTFDVIYINGERSSITSNMGMEWEAWMIIRELYSNALDEGEELVEETEVCEGEVGTTTFFIQIDKDIREVINKWSSYFIPKEEKPLFENSSFKIYNGGDNLRLYKQGILIHEDKNVKSVFNYDIKGATLNELREFKGSMSLEVSSALKVASKEVITIFLDKVREQHYENEMDWNWSWVRFGSGWKEALDKGVLVHTKIITKLVNLGKEVPDNLVVVPKGVYDAVIGELPYLSAITTIKGSGSFYEDYDEGTENRVKQALTILEACDYYMHKDLKFKYGIFENKNVQAQVRLKEKEVLISNSLLQKPLTEIISILIEENEHFMTGYEDHTREFQTHFINLYARTLLSKNSIEI